VNRPGLATTVSQPPAQIAPMPLVIANGTLEAMKWLALVLMTLDHVNKYLFNQMIPVLFALGRIAMPLFVFVLAYNLARPAALAGGAHRRIAVRLALYGALACVPFMALDKVYGGWWPLNIMFTLMVATIVIGLAERGGRFRTTTAVAVFVVGGGLVEYWWFAIGLAIACWRYCKHPSLPRLGALTICLAALWLINQNPWALGALLLILLAPHVELSVTRIPLLFYTYYPTHLGVLFVLSTYLD
jgi:hypothetical protein